jgi:bacteriocin, lactococcin 972 family
MKKICAFILAITILVVSAMPAFAATEERKYATNKQIFGGYCTYTEWKHSDKSHTSKAKNASNSSWVNQTAAANKWAKAYSYGNSSTGSHSFVF